MERAEPSTELVGLAHRARRGDQHALERLLAEVHVYLRRYFERWLFRRLGWQDTLDDLAQEALVKVARGLGDCAASDDVALIVWARTVARNVGTDYLRGMRDEWDQREFLDGIEELVDGDEWERQIEVTGRDIVLRILADVHAAEAEDAQELLWQRVVLGEEWSEAGAALGIPYTAAKRRYQRTQGRIRQAVLKRLIDLAPDELSAVRRWLESIDMPAPSLIRTGHSGDA